MITAKEFKFLLPLACEWVQQQEQHILRQGVELDADQQIDAFLIGVKDPKKVRLLKVDRIPSPSHQALKGAAEAIGLFYESTIGITFRYGIYLRADCWHQR